MLRRLRNCIKKIFLTECEEAPRKVSSLSILGESRTDPGAYGLIHSILGESRTNPADYLEKEVLSSDVPPIEETEVYSFDDLDDPDLEEEPVLQIEYPGGTEVSDFDTLERTFASDTPPHEDVHLTAGVLGRLEGTTLYEAMQSNETIRNKVSSLIAKVEIAKADKEQEKEASGLTDMSRFLETS